MPSASFFGPECAGRSAVERRTRLEYAGREEIFTTDFKRFGYDFFDNAELGLGYGGYFYDGRYAQAAARICGHYGLCAGDRVLDIGCAKGFLLVEFRRLGLQVLGIDVSTYALSNCHEDVRDFVCVGDIIDLPAEDDSFDLVIAKEILPYVASDQIDKAFSECERVARRSVFFEIQSGLTRDELECLRAWDVNHQAVHDPDWWRSKASRMSIPPDLHFKFPFRAAAYREQ